MGSRNVNLQIEPPVSVIAQVVQRLKAAIMTGELQPGERLREADLSRRMGVSRPSIREALSALEAERLVEVFPNRGSSVTKLDPLKVEQIHEVWSLLTGAAAAQFAMRVEKKDIVALKQRLAEFKRATLSGDSLAHVEAANRFFYIITGGLGNAVLSEMIVKLLSRINFLRSLSMSRVETRRQCISSLAEIVAALQMRDPEAARSATCKHIAAACQAVVEIAA